MDLMYGCTAGGNQLRTDVGRERVSRSVRFDHYKTEAHALKAAEGMRLIINDEWHSGRRYLSVVSPTMTVAAPTTSASKSFLMDLCTASRDLPAVRYYR